MIDTAAIQLLRQVEGEESMSEVIMRPTPRTSLKVDMTAILHQGAQVYRSVVRAVARDIAQGAKIHWRMQEAKERDYQKFWYHSRRFIP